MHPEKIKKYQTIGMECLVFLPIKLDKMPIFFFVYWLYALSLAYMTENFSKKIILFVLVEF